MSALAPLRSLLAEWIFDKKLPPRLGFLRALGTALLVALIVQAVTGMLLGLCYVPSPDHAYDSIRYVDEDVKGGRLLRGLHHWGASAIVVLALLHLSRVYFTGAYKRPRGLLWAIGVAILVVILGFGFTGYLLPWDMKGFWATDVGINIVATVPAIGPKVADLLRGGPEVGAPTLTRLFALHVLFLPALLAPLVALHLLLVHKLGITPPGARVGEPEIKSEPFFPRHVLKELVVAALALLVVVAMAWKLGAPLEAPADRDAPAYKPRPEWYFLGLFQLLKLFEGRFVVLGTAVIPGALALLLFFLPLLDRTRARAPRERPIAVSIGVALLLALGTLTVFGALDKGSHSEPPERVPFGDGSYVPPSSPAITKPNDGPPDAAPADDSPRGRLLAEGRGLVNDYGCVECHTLGGKGNTTGSDAPAFEKAAKGRDAKYLDELLLDPKSKHKDTEMPSAKDLKMTDAERAKLVEWLRAVAGD